MKLFSIIIPTLNEAARFTATLWPLQAFRQCAEIILVDGGSTDQTCAIATPLVDCVLHSQPGRALQMNLGAQHAQTDCLIFLHADTSLPRHALEEIKQSLEQHDWGRFKIALTGKHFMLPVVAFMMNVRSHLTCVATGDQVMFCKRSVFLEIDGFPEIDLMEDVAISQRLKQHAGWPALVKIKVISSGRRWDQHGAFKTILLMWSLRLRFALGQNPATLNTLYKQGKLWIR